MNDIQNKIRLNKCIKKQFKNFLYLFPFTNLWNESPRNQPLPKAREKSSKASNKNIKTFQMRLSLCPRSLTLLMQIWRRLRVEPRFRSLKSYQRLSNETRFWLRSIQKILFASHINQISKANNHFRDKNFHTWLTTRSNENSFK